MPIRRRGHTGARARSDQQKGITPCSTLKANLPDSGFDRLCYKNGPFVRSYGAAGGEMAPSPRDKPSAGAAHVSAHRYDPMPYPVRPTNDPAGGHRIEPLELADRRDGSRTSAAASEEDGARPLWIVAALAPLAG